MLKRICKTIHRMLNLSTKAFEYADPKVFSNQF